MYTTTAISQVVNDDLGQSICLQNEQGNGKSPLQAVDDDDDNNDMEDPGGRTIETTLMAGILLV